MMSFVEKERISPKMATDRNSEVAKMVLSHFKLKPENVNLTYKNGVTTCIDKNGLEFIISPKTSNCSVLFYYKPQNGHGDAIFCKLNCNTNEMNIYNTPDKISLFYKEFNQAVKDYKSLIN